VIEPTPPRAFDGLADKYERLLQDPLRDRFAGGSDFFIEQKCRVLMRHLPERSAAGRPLRLLDAGCGQGTAMGFMRGPRRVFGADVSLPMLRDAVKRGPVTVQEPYDLPFADDTFDAAFAFCVYHHIDDGQHVRHLRELSRVVVPGGRVFVFEHNPYNPVTRIIFARAPIDKGCHMISPRALRRLFHDAGLKDVRGGYLLFVPERVWRTLGFLEFALSWLPLGGQYFTSGRKLEGRAV
jgi:SAM-dependent methyltransferase